MTRMGYIPFYRVTVSAAPSVLYVAIAQQGPQFWWWLTTGNLIWHTTKLHHSRRKDQANQFLRDVQIQNPFRDHPLNADASFAFKFEMSTCTAPLLRYGRYWALCYCNAAIHHMDHWTFENNSPSVLSQSRRFIDWWLRHRQLQFHYCGRFFRKRHWPCQGKSKHVC